MTRINVNKHNDLFALTAAFYAMVLLTPWTLPIDWQWCVLLCLPIAAIAWRSFLQPHFRGDGLRCLWVGPGTRFCVDVGGILHSVREAHVIYMSRYCVACELCCANNDRIRVRVLAFGVDERSQYRKLCRYLKTGYAW